MITQPCEHSSMPSPLAPNPIRVQSSIVVYSEPIEIAWRYLSFYLALYPIRDKSLHLQYNS